MIVHAYIYIYLSLCVCMHIISLHYIPRGARCDIDCSIACFWQAIASAAAFIPKGAAQMDMNAGADNFNSSVYIAYWS